MARLRPRVITKLDAERAKVRGAGVEEDSYLAKLVTYIPAESIATYQAMAGFVPENQQMSATPWVALVILALTPAWMFFATKDEGEIPAWFQVLLSPVAFVVWLVALSSPAIEFFTGLQIEPWLASCILIGVTAVIPLLEKLVAVGR